MDLVMWAKNGAKYLPTVLRRIDEVIPTESVSQKIFVDDSSSDNSKDIAKEYGWTVYDNPTGFVNGGANEALRHVKMPYFVSVEQDVILAKNWWETIPAYMEDSTVAVAQGIRVSNHPILKAMDLEITLEALPKGFKFGRVPDRFLSIDNNIYRTKVIENLGGFPDRDPVAVDYALVQDLARKTDYRWVVDPSVVSHHIRSGVMDYLRHEERWMTLFRGTVPIDRMHLYQVIGMTVASPLRGIQISFARRYPLLFFLNQYRSILHLRAYLNRRRRFRDR